LISEQPVVIPQYRILVVSGSYCLLMVRDLGAWGL
jgi:hypothetical protein